MWPTLNVNVYIHMPIIENAYTHSVVSLQEIMDLSDKSNSMQVLRIFICHVVTLSFGYSNNRPESSQQKKVIMHTRTHLLEAMCFIQNNATAN